MKIMSWNVNQFCGMGSWSKYDENGVQNNNYVEIKDREPIKKNVILHVKKFLDKNNGSIVVLQEVPGCPKDKWYNTIAQKQKNQSLRNLFDLFKTKIENSGLKFIPPENIDADEITVAITKNNSGWQNIDSFKVQTENFVSCENNSRIFDKPYKKNFFKNKYIELRFNINERNSLSLLGVHMPIGHTNEKIKKELDKSFWAELANYVHTKKEENFIIIGDFNAYSEKDGNCLYQDEYQNIINEDCEDVVKDYTYEKGFARRKDDHILKTNSVTIKSAEVDKDIKLSDHYPIVAEIPNNFFTEEETNCQPT